MFKSMTLFTTALCNLNCKYCYICKDTDGGLSIIDKDIEEDFKTNKYINQILDYDESLSKEIVSITLWGGEPFLHIERFIEKADCFFQAFPNIDNISTSTNFTLPQQYLLIEELLKALSSAYKKADKKLSVELQISIDGYEEMNDFGRGSGITKKFLDNFYGLLTINVPENIDMVVHTKATLSKETFSFLDSEEKCLKWFTFFEEKMYLPWKDANPKFNYINCLFNCAGPTEWTKEDGLVYAKILNNILSIQNYVLINFDGYKNFLSLIPEASIGIRAMKTNPKNSSITKSMEEVGKSYCQQRCGGSCGAFTGNIVPIPHDLFTMCHRGLFDEYIEYCNNVDNRQEMNGLSEKYFKAHNVKDWLYTKEELKNISHTMEKFDSCPNQIVYTDFIIFISEYAKAGLIDKKYSNVKEINKTIAHMMESSLCVQDAYIMNGSWVTRSGLEIPLLYNGAMDIIVSEYERIYKEYKEKGELL